MTRFVFKTGLWTHEIDITPEMISFRGKTIPAQSITGIGFSLTSMGQITARAAGGIIGSMIANKMAGPLNELEKDVSKLPEKTFGQLIIVYNNEEQKQRVTRIPINTKDEMAKNMLQQIARTFKEKFVGFGTQMLVERTLQIQQKLALVIVIIVLIASFAFAALLIGSGEY